MKQFLFAITFTFISLVVFSTPSFALNCDSTTSVSECLVTNNGLTVGKPVGSSCGENSVCQQQGAPYLDEDKCLCVGVSVTPSATLTPTSTAGGKAGLPPNQSVTVTPPPSLSPIENQDRPCSAIGENTIYPPNSLCYAEVEKVPLNVLRYPLTCIPGPEITYSQDVTAPVAPTAVTTSVTTDLSGATLGFLGPDSLTLSSTNPDLLAKNYLFNALFDRPSYSAEKTPRELFRTYWRVLNSQTQANLKAIYLESTDKEKTKLAYFYLDQNQQQKKTDTLDLNNSLPRCLKKFPVCDEYASEYAKLSADTKARYDTLLPFDFNNSRGYISFNGEISKESIPYLLAIVNALQDQNGLLNSYTPNWAIGKPDNPLTIPAATEETLYPAIRSAGILSSCTAPTEAVSVSAPKTYPVAPTLTQQITIPVKSELVESASSRCICPPDEYCAYSCSRFDQDQTSCQKYGCLFLEKENTYQLTGEGKGKAAVIFNNPLIEVLTEKIVGSGNPGEESFYWMMLPSFAPKVKKQLIGAPISSITSTDPHTTVSNASSSLIYRENNLAQNSMHLLQNCWLVPGQLQSSPACAVFEATVSAFACDGTCSNTLPDRNAVMALKANYVDLAQRWVGGDPANNTPLAAEKFETVVDSALGAGVDPVFALTIWLNESDTSNYSGVCLNLGNHDTSSTYCNRLLDFGILDERYFSNYVTGQFYFEGQLSSFLGLPGYYKQQCGSEMEASSCPMRIFTAMFLGGSCEPSPQTDQYLNSIMSIYKAIAPSLPLPCYPTAYP